MGNDIVVLSGFSSSGKDSLARELDKVGYNFIVTTSTRPMRDYESQGNPYNFIDTSEFLNLIHNDKLIEYRVYDTGYKGEKAKWYYGIEKDQVDSDKPFVVVLDLVGLKAFKEYFGDRVKSFFIHASDEVRRERCIKRGDYDKVEFDRRLADDLKCYPQHVIDNEVDYVIKSTSIKENVEEILRILND